MLLSRAAILDASDLPTEIVPVPEWGGDVKVRTLSGRDRDRFEASLVDPAKGKKKAQPNTDNIRARLVAISVVDEDNQPLFTPADVDVLGAKSAKALGRVFDVAQRLNGFTQADLDEIEKN